MAVSLNHEEHKEHKENPSVLSVPMWLELNGNARGDEHSLATHALAAGCTLVTGNTREFRRVEGLSVESR